MDKFNIFNHWIDLFLSAGNGNNFSVINEKDKALITGLPSPIFNCIIFGQLNEELIQELKSKKIPFVCLPNEKIEKNFEEFCTSQGLSKVDHAMAQEFNDLNLWNYTTDQNIIIKEITNVSDLTFFDHIASIAFAYPEKISLDFLKLMFDHHDITLFLAYKSNIAIGCGIVSLINGIAGLYWDGVLPEYRNEGVATALVKYRMNFIKDKGFKSVYAQNLTPSVKYYQKIGFKPVGSLPLYISL